MRLAVLLALAPAVAGADDVPTPEELAADIDDLYTKQEALERKQRSDDAAREQVKTLLPLRRFLTVFVDVGAFAVAGDGSGIRSDIGHLYFPQYTNRIAGQWVFMGDPLSTAINTLGEPSDTGNSRSVARDTINSEGRPSFFVNAVGLVIAKAVRQDLSVNAFAQLLPRPGANVLDVQLAQIEYRPLGEQTNLVIGAGKIDSVLGIEYRAQDPLTRVGVTPSLIARYTTGRPLGVRAQLRTETYDVSGTLTNGDSFQTRFEPERELDANSLPTAAFHFQGITREIGEGLTLGASFAVGPQDGQADAGVLQWHAGLDARLEDVGGWNVSAEYAMGRQLGKSTAGSMMPCDIAACLRYRGGYLLVDRRVTAHIIPYARIDWRSAVHTSGTAFVYESHVWRATIGGHFEMTSRIVGKLEYTLNRELGAIPQFPDDILTTSIVVATD